MDVTVTRSLMIGHTHPLIPSLDAFCTPDASVLVTSLGMILVLGVNSSSMASVAARRMKGQMKEWRVSVCQIRQNSSSAGLFYILNCEIMLKIAIIFV